MTERVVQQLSFKYLISQHLISSHAWRQGEWGNGACWRGAISQSLLSSDKVYIIICILCLNNKYIIRAII